MTAKNKIARKYNYKHWDVVLLYVSNNIIHTDKFDKMIDEVIEETTKELFSQIQNLKEDLENAKR